MIELKTSYSFSGVPYITYDALDDYAEEVVDEFAPAFLNYPGIINEECFIEDYLELETAYHRIQYERKILGMTAFNNGVLQVANEETGLPEPMPVLKGTVVLDTSLEGKRNLPRLRFTAMHESSHWILHRKAFAENNPFGAVGTFENQYLAAKEGRIDYSRSRKERTDIQIIERQADFLSSAILIPRPALREAYREFFRYYHEKPRRIIKGSGNPMDDCFAVELPKYVAGLFCVSKRAALIRLEKLTAIVDSKTWRGARS